MPCTVYVRRDFVDAVDAIVEARRRRSDTRVRRSHVVEDALEWYLRDLNTLPQDVFTMPRTSITDISAAMSIQQPDYGIEDR